MKKLLSIAFASILMTGTAWAGAAVPHNEGLYLGAFGAYSLMNDADADLTSTSENADEENKVLGQLGLNNVEAMIDDGFRYGIEGGYDFGMFRAGLEVSYGHHDVTASKGFVINFDQNEDRWPAINGQANARAELGLLPIFVTGGVDFPLDEGFTLSLNAGIGPVLAKLEEISADVTLTQDFGEGEVKRRNFSAGTFNDSEWTWGAQVGPDIEYEFGDSGVSVVAGYRFMYVDGPEFSINETGTIDVNSLYSHNFRIGGRIRL